VLPIGQLWKASQLLEAKVRQKEDGNRDLICRESRKRLNSLFEDELKRKIVNLGTGSADVAMFKALSSPAIVDDRTQLLRVRLLMFTSLLMNM